jgi:hypothetical protein
MEIVDKKKERKQKQSANIQQSVVSDRHARTYSILNFE